MPRSSKPRKKYNPARPRRRTRLSIAERVAVERLLRQAQLTLMLKLPEGSATLEDLAILRDLLNWMRVAMNNPARKFIAGELPPWQEWLDRGMLVVHDVMVGGESSGKCMPSNAQYEEMLDSVAEAGRLAQECFEADPMQFIAEWKAMAALSHEDEAGWSVHRQVEGKEINALLSKAYSGRA